MIFATDSHNLHKNCADELGAYAKDWTLYEITDYEANDVSGENYIVELDVVNTHSIPAKHK